jgi:hypothetical protein
MLAPLYLTPSPTSSPVGRGDIYEFINAQSDDPVLLDNLRHHRIYNAFYLPPEAAFSISESYADFRRLQPLHRDFLEPGKRRARLSPSTMQAMLAQFSKFMLRI